MWNSHTWDAIWEQATDIHGTTWMKLKHVLQNERSQTQNTAHYMIPFICKVRKRKIYRDRRQTVVARGWAWEQRLR